jgi:ABC-type Mn2+/Zn2+ transport system ATPase subunit
LKPSEGRIDRDTALVVSYLPQRDRLDTMLPITALDVVEMGRAAYAGPIRRMRRTR